MAKPTTALCGLKLLIKIIIALAIIVAILVAAVLIVGNMSLSSLKLDGIKLGDSTLADLGLSETSLKTVLKASYKLAAAKEEDFITNPYDAEDKAEADAMFSALPKGADNATPVYATLLATKANFADDKNYTLSEESLCAVYDQIFTSGEVYIGDMSKFGMKVSSVHITKEAAMTIVFTIDISSVTGGLPKIPFLKWPQSAYVSYTANITVGEDGKFATKDNAISINGLDAQTTGAIITAISTKTGFTADEGKGVEATLTSRIQNVTDTAVANMGTVGYAGTNSDKSVDRSDVKLGNNGIEEGSINFLKFV